MEMKVNQRRDFFRKHVLCTEKHEVRDSGMNYIWQKKKIACQQTLFNQLQKRRIESTDFFDVCYLIAFQLTIYEIN